MIVGAGLPKIYKMLSDEKSFSERLFLYKEIGSLTREQAKKAIEEPAKKFGVFYSDSAIDKIVNVTNGYPFFIQQLCKIVFNSTDGDFIDIDDIKEYISVFFDTLDTGFLR